MSNPLRNPAINYSAGWFFVTAQVAHNKSQFGVIAGGRCELNELGHRVSACWEGLFERHPEAWRDACVVMPNHFHAVIRIHDRPTNKPNHLAYLLQGFKSFTTHEYHAMARAGRCPDIGPRLWQGSYYDNLVTSHRELENIRAYIRANPARWDRDRFGPVTAHHCGDLELLNQPLVAYVASEGLGRDTEVPPHDREAVCWGGEVPPHEREAAHLGVEAVRFEMGVPGGGSEMDPLAASTPHLEHTGPQSRESQSRGPQSRESQYRGSGPPCPGPVISTFTSAQERAVLSRCLATRRAYVHVMPGGIPEPLPPAWAQACAEGRALLLSPSAPGTGVNKQRAIWCNRYVLDHAAGIWHGHIRPGGTLETLLRSLPLSPPQSPHPHHSSLS